MSVKSKKMKYASNKDAQLHWFINKLLLLSQKPITGENEFNEFICLPIELLKKETTLFPIPSINTPNKAFGYTAIVDKKYYDNFCSPMLARIKRDTNKLRVHGLHSLDKEFFGSYDEGALGYGSAVFVNLDYVPLLEIYLKYLVKESNNNRSDSTIQKIEILKDENERGRIKVYINGNYNNEPLDFARGKNWELMYKVANKEYVAYDRDGKAFYSYFNYQQTNPLYAKYKFKVTQILKREDSEIKSNIEIKLITKNKTTRQLKSA